MLISVGHNNNNNSVKYIFLTSRYINKHGEDNITAEIKAYIEDLVSNIDAISLDDDDFDYSNEELNESSEEK